MSLEGDTILLQQPKRLFFGDGCSSRAADEFASAGLKRLLLVTGRRGRALSEGLVATWRKSGATVEVHCLASGEPDLATFRGALVAARAFHPDGVIGLGGGSPLDVAKLDKETKAIHDRLKQALTTRMARPDRRH